MDNNRDPYLYIISPELASRGVCRDFSDQKRTSPDRKVATQEIESLCTSDPEQVGLGHVARLIRLTAGCKRHAKSLDDLLVAVGAAKSVLPTIKNAVNKDTAIQEKAKNVGAKVYAQAHVAATTLLQSMVNKARETNERLDEQKFRENELKPEAYAEQKESLASYAVFQEEIRLYKEQICAFLLDCVDPIATFDNQLSLDLAKFVVIECEKTNTFYGPSKELNDHRQNALLQLNYYSNITATRYKREDENAYGERLSNIIETDAFVAIRTETNSIAWRNAITNWDKHLNELACIDIEKAKEAAGYTLKNYTFNPYERDPLRPTFRVIVEEKIKELSRPPVREIVSLPARRDSVLSFLGRRLLPALVS